MFALTPDASVFAQNEPPPNPSKITATPDPDASRITYPRKNATPENTFTIDTLKMATAQLMSWRQGAGAFGHLHLHASWGVSASLERRYQGQTISRYMRIMDGVIQIANHSDDPDWRLLADDIAAAILYLQTPNGGFYHASSEAEPTYTSDQSTTVHQAQPIIALLDYAAWPHANPQRVAQIKLAIEKWWPWLHQRWWQRGNAWTRKNNTKRNWFCGVTNQDISIVAALARYGQVFGNWEPWGKYGKTTLNTLIGPDYYFPETGLFLRGDNADYYEHSAYYDIILPMLEITYAATGDTRLPPIIDRACEYLFETLHTGPDGLTHVARRAKVSRATGKISEWEQQPYAFNTYPLLILHMRDYLARHPDAIKTAQLQNLEKTLASYIYSDGTIPIALGAKSAPVFFIAGHPNYHSLWFFLVRHLGPKNKTLALNDLPKLPTVMRTYGDSIWLADEKLWMLKKNGRRIFAGIKCESAAIAIGSEEPLAGVNLRTLNKPQIIETVSEFK
ncbi:hypothetical protein Ga0100231_022630 [Opitutaceae bacterium TAV4]|nr:hypothetical protein Ga0100231_022630 [Opitutaceae bacterium TAV4]RRK00653.1 hypothetical protein Ga0100230_022870 [Opitutaceae bacterium TAV3]